MPVKFDFISPEILLTEVDNSTLPTVVEDDGILIIGQAPMGPALKPVKVRSFDDFKAVFGEPQSGNSSLGDWRYGNTAQPMYGMYAAQAWFASDTSPVTYVRLAGDSTSTTIKSGWNLGGQNNTKATPSTNIGAYGLWVAPSGTISPTSASVQASGTLAAIVYTKGAAPSLSGSMLSHYPSSAQTTSSIGTFIQADGNGSSYGTFTIDFWSSPTAKKSKTFNLDPSSGNGIRSVLNTDPHRLIGSQKSTTENYFLGESYETEVYNLLNNVGSASAGQQFAVLLPLAKGAAGTSNWVERNNTASPAKTGWFVAPYEGPKAQFNKNNLKKLFRFVSLNDGSKFAKKYYIEIELLSSYSNLADEYNKFNVTIKDMQGLAIEGPKACTLNPNSDDFIAKAFGNQVTSYNSTKGKLITSGEYAKNSDYVYVEMHDDYKTVPNNTIPFGFYGPYVPSRFRLVSGSAAINQGSNTWATNGRDDALWAGHQGADFVDHGDMNGVKFDFNWPSLQITDEKSNSGNGYKFSEPFGVRHYRDDVGTKNGQPMYDMESSEDFCDLIRSYQEGISPHASSGDLVPSFIFTFDEVKAIGAGSEFNYFQSGSYEDGTSHAGHTGGSVLSFMTSSNNLNKKLQTPFFGGDDGVDIQYVDPFSEDNLPSNATKLNRYTYEAVDRVLDIVDNSEVVKYEIISMPGIVNVNLVNKLVTNTTERSDSLAIVDIRSGFTGKHENAGTDELGTINTIKNRINTHRFNSSYAASYWPEVVCHDGAGEFILPSSVAGVGAIAASEKATGVPWFAPAGFNRGGISKLGGSAGPTILRASETLTKAERDILYERNINPIANFPGEGPVVFGQKTLQRTRSALDRINVRRLMLWLKKRIGNVARTILFDNNVQATWNRFRAGAVPFLIEAQNGFGIAEFKLILDETTTTADYIDRNIMYAKIFVKPAYAIEFIAVEFTITRTGIEF